MKTIPWKTVLIIGILAIIIVIIILVARNNKQANLQPTQTQIIEISATKKESTPIVLPTIAEKSTPTRETFELRPSSTSLPTLTQIPTLEKLIIKSSTPTNTPTQLSAVGNSYPTDKSVSYLMQQPTVIVKTQTLVPPMPTNTQVP